MWSQKQAKPTCNNEWVPGLGGGETDCIVAQKLEMLSTLVVVMVKLHGYVHLSKLTEKF